MSRTATATATRRQYRVACQAYATKPVRSLDAAQDLMAQIETPVAHGDGSVRPGCSEWHRVETRVGREWLPVQVAQAREILAGRLRQRFDSLDGALLLAEGYWPHDAMQRPEVRAVLAQENPDNEALHVALGSFERATLSADGKYVSPGWCKCGPLYDEAPAFETLVRYERWTAEGRVAHGFACPSCRGVAQSG